MHRVCNWLTPNKDNRFFVESLNWSSVMPSTCFCPWIKMSPESTALTWRQNYSTNIRTKKTRLNAFLFWLYRNSTKSRLKLPLVNQSNSILPTQETLRRKHTSFNEMIMNMSMVLRASKISAFLYCWSKAAVKSQEFAKRLTCSKNKHISSILQKHIATAQTFAVWQSKKRSTLPYVHLFFWVSVLSRYIPLFFQKTQHFGAF